MTNQPSKRPKVLTRLKIDEISMVDRGAGEGCKVVISKRDDSAADEGRGLYFDLLTGRTTTAELYGKSNYATGDEATGLIDEPTRPVDPVIADGIGGPKAIEFDAGDFHYKFPNKRAMAIWLASQERINKSHHEEAPMPNLSDIVKAHGVVALCKYMCEQNSSFGATEHELVRLATEDAHRRNPESTPAVAFAAMYEKSAELRGAIEIAKSAAFEDAMTAELERDSRKACEELSAIGKQRWPNLSPSQRFARAFETNPEIAKRAHRRPGPSTSFAHPVAKNLAAPVYDPKPTFVGDDAALDVDDPQEAVRQLKELGRSRWPSATALEQFERALTDPENAELVQRAFARPTGSSPPRQ